MDDNHSFLKLAVQSSFEKLNSAILDAYKPTFDIINVRATKVLVDLVNEIANTIITSMKEIIVNSQAMKGFIDSLQSLQSTLTNELFDAFVKGISVDSDHIEISDKAYDSLSLFIDYPNDENSQPITKFSFKDFLTIILFPLLLTICTMLQTSYYHQIDALEAQKQQLEEEAYRQQCIQLTIDYNNQIQQLNNTAELIAQYLEVNNSEYHSAVATNSNAAPVTTEPDFAIADESDIPDIPQQPD